MTNFVAGAEQRLNPIRSGDQSAPNVVGLANGGFVVDWLTGSYSSDDFTTPGGAMQVYDASGAPVGGEISLGDYFLGPGREIVAPTIAALADGGFVVAWGTLEFSVSAQIFDATGVAIGDAFTVNTSPLPNPYPPPAGYAGETGLPSVTATADGGFIVTWATLAEIRTPSGTSVISRTVEAMRFDATGTAVGTETQVDEREATESPAFNFMSLPVITTLADGGYAVAWQVFNPDDASYEIYARSYNASGAPAGNAFKVNTTITGDQIEPSIAALDGGGFVVAWTSQGQDGSGAGVYAQRYDANGTAVGGETRVNTTTAGDQDTSVVAGLQDGGYVVAWASDHAGGTDIYAQRYDANGVAVGGETRVSEVTEVGQGQPSITVRTDGSYLISWASGDEASVGREVYGRIFWPGDVAGQVITGTEGNDNLGGAAGNDTLIGLGGDDWLNGAPGNDLMQGGTGNDTYVVDDAGDVVQEAADAGIDTVRTSLTVYALPDNVENLAYTGRKAFTGSGNALDNTITGNIAADHLSGGDGNDTLVGDDGADQLSGGRGHDNLEGGRGNDSLYGGSGIDWLDGGLGNDMMAGGDGYDTYVVDSLGDQVIEEVDAGIDTVRTALAAYTLGDNVENLVFTGTGAFTGNGNALANVLTGGGGNDWLSGGDDNDTLQGGDGVDELYGGRGHDHLDGGEGNDQLFGGSGIDTLEGGGGNDRLDGGAGGDTLTAGAGRDLFIYRDVSDSGGSAIDTITDFSMAGRDLINLSIIDANSTTAENDRFTYIGAAAFSGTAGELRYAGDLLEGDVNGDSVADLVIKVANIQPDGRGIIL